MMISLLPRFRFTTTLQILTRNRNQLKTIQKNQIANRNTHKIKANRFPYYSMNIQFVKSNSLIFSNNFPQLDVFRNKLLPNLALANGSDYQQYTLPKIIHICLKQVQQQNQNRQMWKKLEDRITFLLRNTSVLQNIQLLYISINRFSIQLQTKLLKLIQEQIKFLTPLQKQFLYYSLSQIRDKISPNHEHLGRLNKLKQDLALSVQRTKINLATLIQWIILVSVTNASNLWTVTKYYQKVHLYTKYILTPQQFISLLKCLEFRSILTAFEQNRQIKQKGKQLIELFKTSVPNYDLLLNTSQEKNRIKMLLSYYYPQLVQNRLSTQQITSPQLSSAQKLKYLHWLWKNDFKQIYQLKSIYQSIQLQQQKQPQIQNKQQFKNIDMLYYISLIQMGLKTFKNYEYVVNKTKQLSYLPRGLQWPIWNYIISLTKNKILHFENAKQNIEQIVNKIQKVNQVRNKQKYIEQEIKRCKDKESIQQIQKFLHSIKVWSFKSFEPIAPVDHIDHFINHEMKVILHCVIQQDLIERESKQINNEYLLNKNLLKQNFGYSVIDINVKQFLQMNYNDRIQWLHNKTKQFGKTVGKISHD